MVGERQKNKMTFRQKKEELLKSLRGISLEDPPTEVWEPGTKVWMNEREEWHREGDLPAVIHADGTQKWYKNDKIHRAGGKPAIIYADGTKQWWENGERVK